MREEKYLQPHAVGRIVNNVAGMLHSIENLVQFKWFTP